MNLFYKIVFFIAIIGIFLSVEPFEHEKKDKLYQIANNSSKIVVDGLMLEDVWKNIDVISDYIQYSPYNKSEPTFKTETRMFYNDKGIYIFSRMYDDEPDKIQERLAIQDDYNDGFLESSDWMAFSFDSRHDHQTGYVFGVNCSGIKVDGSIYDDYGIDLDYNALWYAETNIDEFGWTVEMMIPFSALRFDSDINEVWGFNSKRYIYRFDEISSWVVFPFEINGVSSTFGHIEGFENIKDFKKVHLTPYLSSNGTIDKYSELKIDEYGQLLSGNSRNDTTFNYTENKAGFDMKYNFNTRSAIDISYNPDYGQVEVDPADINISYYETYLEEKRPFFTENSMMFSTPIEMLYSRRIGDFKDNLNNNIDNPTLIDYAIKISGKETNGFSYGYINASTKNQINDTLIIVPRIKNNRYNILRLKQDILEGNSYIGLMATNYNGLRGLYSKQEDSSIYINTENEFNANTYSIDSRINLFNNSLQSNIQIAQSDIGSIGKASFIDLDYTFNEYWSTYMSYDYIDEIFNNNDIGYIKRDDIESIKFNINYHDFNPTDKFIERRVSLSFINSQNISANTRLDKSISIDTQLDFINSQSILFGLKKSYNHFDDRKLFDYKDNQLAERSMFVPNSNKIYLGWESDPRNINAFAIGFFYRENQINDNLHGVEYNHVFRPDYNIKLSFNYFYQKGDEKYYFLESLNDDDGNPHHVFSNKNIDKRQYTLRYDAFLSKNITLQNFTQFISTNNNFSNYMELQDGDIYPYETDYIKYGGGLGGYPIYAEEGDDPQGNQIANPNNDPLFLSKYNELIYNLVLKWQFNPRSNLYLVYTRYWYVNGKTFNSFLDFLDYSGNEPWVESSFDQGMTIKYNYQFEI